MVINYRAKRNGRGDYHNDFEVMSRRGGGGVSTIITGGAILSCIRGIIRGIIMGIIRE